MLERGGSATREPVAEGPLKRRTLPTIVWLDRGHGYNYTRWFYFSVALAKRSRPLVQTVVSVLNARARAVPRMRGLSTDTPRDLLAESVHGKVICVEHAGQLVEVNQDIDLRGLEKVVPYSQARDIVMRNPKQIVIMDCPCRVARGERACQPLDVCMIVGEPFATQFIDHHPGRARRIDAKEASEILLDEHQRGHVHHAFFKDAMLGRPYAVCSRCSCCSGPMNYFRHGTPMLASSSNVARVDLDACARCGACADSCQFGALSLRADEPEVCEERCMGCGVCAYRRAFDALALFRDPRRGEPLAIHELLRQA